MMVILSDISKFLWLGPAEKFDHTTSSETKFQRRLVEFVKRGFLSSTIAEQIRPTASIRPRLYGLPKTHKEGIPLGPILSMVGSSQHRVAKWLERILCITVRTALRILFNFLVLLRIVVLRTNLCIHLTSVASLLVFPSRKLLTFVPICYTEVI